MIVLFPLLMMVFAMPMMGMMGWWWGGGMAGSLSPLWGIGMRLVVLVSEWEGLLVVGFCRDQDRNELDTMVREPRGPQNEHWATFL
nr:hypothetical protein [Haloplanus aerogenes]